MPDMLGTHQCVSQSTTCSHGAYTLMVAVRQMSKYIQTLANATKEKQGAVIALMQGINAIYRVVRRPSEVISRQPLERWGRANQLQWAQSHLFIHKYLMSAY